MQKFSRFLSVLVLIAIILLSFWGINFLVLGLGHNAHTYCSCYFVSEREDCLEKDLQKFGYFNREIDQEHKLAKANLFGFFERVAVYRDGLGCTLLPKGTNDYKEQKQSFNSQNTEKDTAIFPNGDSIKIVRTENDVDYQVLDLAIQNAFKEENPNLKKETRTVIVYHKGQIIASKFKSGFTPTTKQLGWSMTKSFVGTLAGLMIKDKFISLDDHLYIEGWQDDKRKNITLDQMLRMSSGLHFKEEYLLPSLATEMLFNSYSMAELPNRQKLEHNPDEFFLYSSGTTNALSKYLSDVLMEQGIDPIDYLNNKLFDPLGMNNSLIELDAAGYISGSSYGYCSALDWLRFGILYLNKGSWNNQEILSEQWVDYVSTPTPTCDSAAYGAHFWLNAGFKEDASDRRWPDLPSDVFFPSGHAGQHIFIIPSMDLVVMRLGNASEKKAWNESKFLRSILYAFPTENLSLHPETITLY